jgi:hypothetical protein
MHEGTYETEYLVNIDFLKKEFLEKCDLELIDSGLFENLYYMQKEFFETSHKYESKAETKKFFNDVSEYYSDKSEINTACKKLTSLMTYFVFRKKDRGVKEQKNSKKQQKGGDKRKFIDSKKTIKSKNFVQREIISENSFFACCMMC